MQTRLAVAALSIAFGLPSCIMFRSEPKCFVFSEPPGATILLDGKDSGFTTPAALEPGDATITVMKDGYFPQVRAVSSHLAFRIPRHNDGGTGTYAIAMPLFWTFDDLLFPFQFRYGEHPRRIFCRLVPLDRPDERIPDAVRG